MEERKCLEYYVLDVFSTMSYKGNPLSVVFTDGHLTLEQYENISREFGYSETSFIFYSAEQKALNVRSFSPTGFEVDGAGHNLLGAVCAALFKKMLIFEEQNTSNRFVLMKDAPIPVTITFDAINPVVQMQQRAATIGSKVPASDIANALGLSPEQLSIDDLVPTIVQTEVAHVMVPVKNLQLLNGCQPDSKRLMELSKYYQFEGFYCFAFAGKNHDHIVESRFFNPLIGIEEDAATGTAAGPLIGFLTKHNYTGPNKEYTILQGVKLNQPSLLKVMNRTNDILVGGAAALTMQGRIYL